VTECVFLVANILFQVTQLSISVAGLGSVPGDASEIIPASKPARPIQSGTLSEHLAAQVPTRRALRQRSACLINGIRRLRWQRYGRFQIVLRMSAMLSFLRASARLSPWRLHTNDTQAAHMSL
jgi:hypothetical protein